MTLKESLEIEYVKRSEIYIDVFFAGMPIFDVRFVEGKWLLYKPGEPFDETEGFADKFDVDDFIRDYCVDHIKGIFLMLRKYLEPMDDALKAIK